MVRSFCGASLRHGLFVGLFKVMCSFSEAALLESREKTGMSLKQATTISSCIASLSLLVVGRSGRSSIAAYFAVRACYAIAQKYLKKQTLIDEGNQRRLGILWCCALCSVISYKWAFEPERFDSDPDYFNLLTILTGINRNIYNQFFGKLQHGDSYQYSPSYFLASSLLKGSPQSITKQIVNGSSNEVYCAILHPGEPCGQHLACTSFALFKKVLPSYFAIYLFTQVIFKGKIKISNILPTLVKAAKSSLFAPCFFLLLKGYMCARSKHLNLPEHPSLYYLCGFIPALTILIESQTRRTELSLYFLDKVIAILQPLDGNIMDKVPFGPVITLAISTSVLMSAFRSEPENLNYLTRTILSLVFPKIA